MEIFHNLPQFRFMKYRHIFALISAALIGTAIFGWVSLGDKKYGVDFLGGSEIIVEFKEPVDVAKVRAAAESTGASSVSVQAFEGKTNQYSIRLRGAPAAADASAVKPDPSKPPEKMSAKVIEAVRQVGPLDVLKEDEVGPVIGRQILRDGVLAISLGLLGILIYISVRFEWPYAVGAVGSLLHDVIVCAGFYALAGHEFNAPMLAALLTIVGYSVNDTIIIFDRIRDNMGLMHKGKDKMSFLEIVDLSMNQTLSRTILTSLTILFSALMLWLVGTGSISELGFAFTIGTVAGTLSTIFIACPLVNLCRQLQKGSA
jgi:preprotein translocase SecF subunit